MCLLFLKSVSTSLAFKPLHLLSIQHLQKQQYTEFTSISFLHTPHGYLPDAKAGPGTAHYLCLLYINFHTLEVPVIIINDNTNSNNIHDLDSE